jgi:Mg2+-importing ATPase
MQASPFFVWTGRTRCFTLHDHEANAMPHIEDAAAQADYLTYGALLFVLRATPELFRTGWFMESVISASLIVLVICTRKPFFCSRPGRPLFVATLIVAAATLILPTTPLGSLFEFSPIPAEFIALMGAMIAFYVLSAEVAKRLFYSRLAAPGRR